MTRKPKFKPVITRVKLNPEQAVLQCSCFDRGFLGVRGGGTRNARRGGAGCFLKFRLSRAGGRGTWGQASSAAVS